MLSTRADVVGPRLAEELSVLQADVPTDAPEQVRETIESELGKSAGEAFAELEDQPLASGSIGQVHAATTLQGEPVVVKVLHDGIDEAVKDDLEILGSLAEVAEKHPVLRLYRPRETVAEFPPHPTAGARPLPGATLLETVRAELRRRPDGAFSEVVSRAVDQPRPDHGAVLRHERGGSREAQRDRDCDRGHRAPWRRSLARDDLSRRVLSCRPAPREHVGFARRRHRSSRLRDGRPSR